MPPSLCVNSLKTRVLFALCGGVPVKLYPGHVGIILFELAHLNEAENRCGYGLYHVRGSV